MFDTLKQQIAGYVLGGALIITAAGLANSRNEVPEPTSITIQTNGQTHNWPIRDMHGDENAAKYAKQELTRLLFETERAYGRQLTANKQAFLLYCIDSDTEYDQPHKGALIPSEITRYTPQELADIVRTEFGK